jgi:hypothetical protein
MNDGTPNIPFDMSELLFMLRDPRINIPALIPSTLGKNFRDLQLRLGSVVDYIYMYNQYIFIYIHIYKYPIYLYMCTYRSVYCSLKHTLLQLSFKEQSVEGKLQFPIILQPLFRSVC